MNITGWLILIGVIGFIIYCFLAEANCSAKNSPAIVTILCRLVARHIKLAWKLFAGLLYFTACMICIFKMQKPTRPATPEGNFANFMDRVTTPVQMIVDGLIGLLGLLAIGVLFGLVAIKDSVGAHPRFWLGVVVLTYLLWLVVTVSDLVEDEVVSGWTHPVNEDYPKRILTKQDHITWSVLTFVVWIAALATTGAWLSSHFAYTPHSGW
jgi:hypothetical protein